MLMGQLKGLFCAFSRRFTLFRIMPLNMFELSVVNPTERPLLVVLNRFIRVCHRQPLLVTSRFMDSRDYTVSFGHLLGEQKIEQPVSIVQPPNSSRAVALVSLGDHIDGDIQFPARDGLHVVGRHVCKPERKIGRQKPAQGVQPFGAYGP